MAKQPEILFAQEEIKQTIAKLAAKIRRDYLDKGELRTSLHERARHIATGRVLSK